MKTYEVEIAVSDIKTGRFVGIFLVEVTCDNEREAIELGVHRADVSFNSGVKLECNGVKELL